MTSSVALTARGSVAEIRLARPGVHNAFDEQLIAELSDVLAQVEADASVRAVVLTGEGASFSAGADLNWMRSMASYQARLSLPISARDKFELVWLGSYDQAGFVDNRNVKSDYRLEFHRAEARLIRHVGPYELGAALQFGFERSQINNSMKVSALRVGPRVYASYRASQQLQLRVGADLFGSTGSFVRSPVIEDGLVQIRLPPFSSDVAARSVMGAYAELGLQLSDRFRADLGLRADLWLTGSHPEAAADPRLSMSYRVLDSMTWHGAVGLAHQPSVFLVPLPGITEG